MNMPDERITDEQLMSYADGECDDALRLQVEQALRRDAQLAARLQKHLALRQQLSSAYDPILSEPVPDRLLAALRPQTQTHTRAQTNTETKVIPLKPRTITRSWQWPQWSAMAASLVIGVFIGLFAFNQQSSLVMTDGKQLIARGALMTALDQQLANTQQNNATVRMNLSFKNKQGAYCRTFVAAEQSLAGLACHTQDAWQIRALTSVSASTNDPAYRQATSALPAAILAAVDQEMSGDSLDIDEERQARDARWR